MTKLNLIFATVVGLALLSCARSVSNQTGERESSLHRTLKTDSVIYGVVPPMFGRHPFRDVTARLDSLKDLGVDALWISPVNETDDDGWISYSVTNYFGLRGDFGSEAEFRTLIREAHVRGIKVLMDFVPNHTSDAHPHFKDAQARGKNSPYYDFYVRNESGDPQYYFNWSNLMNLNYANENVRKQMREAFQYWVREFGIDGYRVDAAWGVEQREPGFWSDLITSLRQINPDVTMLAEATARDQTYYKSGFDLAYDWNSELGHWAWEKAFDDRSQSGAMLAEAIAKDPYPEQVIRFINNNDTGERFLTRHGLELTKVAAALTITVPGIPVLYSGDEVGAEYTPYESPHVIDWSQDPKALRVFYKRLLGLRRRETALQNGAYRLLTAPNSVLAFDRGDNITVVLNFGAATESITTDGGTDELTGKVFAAGLTHVPAATALILVREKRGN